jgi:geranylgeranyl diphosphate synthase type II
MEVGVLKDYLASCRALAAEQIREIVPENRYSRVLYDLMLEYPLRLGKGFRPALCIASTRAQGGRLQDVLRTAAVLELYHNGFLVHDDVEDGSHLRRGEPTLHTRYGIPVAVNVGDAMFALCLQPLLDNMRSLGLCKALAILETVARMARESAEGQAIELDWIRHGNWSQPDRSYCQMSFKKTCWYTFITPLQIGGIVAGVDCRRMTMLRRFGSYIGVAFQIQDDILNLVAEEHLYGKEIGGDLWEGKHTVMLLHMMRTVSPADRNEAQRILQLAREKKTLREIEFLWQLMGSCGSVAYASRFAGKLAEKALRVLEADPEPIPPSVHRDFLIGMVDYVVSRNM